MKLPRPWFWSCQILSYLNFAAYSTSMAQRSLTKFPYFSRNSIPFSVWAETLGNWSWKFKIEWKLLNVFPLKILIHIKNELSNNFAFKLVRTVCNVYNGVSWARKLQNSNVKVFFSRKPLSHYSLCLRHEIH